jgi:hypothetical protein
MKGGTTQNIIIFEIEIPEKKEEKQTKQQDLVVELLLNKDITSNSTISSILIKLILEYCIPLIDEIPKVVVSSRDIEKRSDIKAESKIKIEKGISILLDRDITCIYKNDKIKVVSGQMIVILGFIIPDYIKSNLILNIYDYLSTDSKYKCERILRTGLYSTYNCYKNYFFSAYLNKPLYTKESKIEFSNNTSDNNLKILKYLEYCRILNSIYNSTLLLTIKSISLNKELIALNNRFNLNT